MGKVATMSTTWLKKIKGTIETSSKMRRWWLNKIQGYEVLEEKMSPRKGSFGRVAYVRIWVLRPGNTET
jgi:hypothetical protein